MIARECRYRTASVEVESALPFPPAPRSELWTGDLDSWREGSGQRPDHRAMASAQLRDKAATGVSGAPAGIDLAPKVNEALTNESAMCSGRFPHDELFSLHAGAT